MSEDLETSVAREMEPLHERDFATDEKYDNSQNPEDHKKWISNWHDEHPGCGSPGHPERPPKVSDEEWSNMSRLYTYHHRRATDEPDLAGPGSHRDIVTLTSITSLDIKTVPRNLTPGDSESIGSDAHGVTGPQSWKTLFSLSLGSLGVVYGDLVTSPLYVFGPTFAANKKPPTEEELLGSYSVILWLLIIVAVYHYGYLLLNADAYGEGGIFALLSILRRAKGILSARTLRFWSFMTILGSGLLVGDGVLTPAISVLSAMEGIAVYNSGFTTDAVIGLSVFVLLVLFGLQKFGTGFLGKLFGPLMFLWLVTAFILGFYSIATTGKWIVFTAFSPHYAFKHVFIDGHFLKLGTLCLCTTGVEALYADMGHFGATPIRMALYGLCFPTLILLYGGQTAAMMADPEAYTSPFFRMVPTHPVVYWWSFAVAMFGTVVASQSGISAASSLVNQAIELNFFPRVNVEHTSEEVVGQIRVPVVDWTLMVLCVIIVAGFRTSNNLADAYGVSVTAVMLTTSMMYTVVLHVVRKTNRAKIAAYVCGIGVLNAVLFAAALSKFHKGGWFTVVLGILLGTIGWIWYDGHRLLLKNQSHGTQLGILARYLQNNKMVVRSDSVAVFLSRTADPEMPVSAERLTSWFGVLPKHCVILHIRVINAPFVAPKDSMLTCTDMKAFGEGLFAAVTTYGYAQAPEIHKIASDILDLLAKDKGGREGVGSEWVRPTRKLHDSGFVDKVERSRMNFPDDDKMTDARNITYFVESPIIMSKHNPSSIYYKFLVKLYSLLSKNSASFVDFYSIPATQRVDIGEVYEL